MTYQPGAALSMVEMHVMEHGLIMLEVADYRLADAWYPVTAGDFHLDGPWCPQWFGAIGKLPAKYLIYKDWIGILWQVRKCEFDDRSGEASLEIEALAQISDAEPPAVTRVVFTPTDLKARTWLRKKCLQQDLAVRQTPSAMCLLVGPA